MTNKPIDISDLYRPLRDHLIGYGSVESLEAIWAYHQNLTDDVPLPPESICRDPKSGRQVPLKDHVYLWDLALLAREIVLNGSRWGGKSLGFWDNLANALNRIRDLDNKISKRKSEADDYDVLWDLFPLIHDQFEWQRPPSKFSLVRYYKIFGESEVGELVEAATGLTLRQLYHMTFAVSGNFKTKSKMLTNNSYAVIGISDQQRDLFFSLVCGDLITIKEAVSNTQNYDASWNYTFNPLKARPLVRVDHQHPERVLCPIPTFLMTRVTQGIFYDIVGAKGFQNAYGKAFENYVGKILTETCGASGLTVSGETPYTAPGKNLRHGVDWTLRDATGTVFIECKAKRVRQDAKAGGDGAALSKELETMAEYIVQHYKNIDDALSGLTAWVSDGTPVYPLIITLEPWWIFNPVIRNVLEAHIRRHLAEQGLNEEVLETMPYTIASIDEAERAFHVLAQVGISDFFGSKIDPKHREWALFPFFQAKFSHVAAEAADKFYSDEFLKLFPDEVHSEPQPS